MVIVLSRRLDTLSKKEASTFCMLEMMAQCTVVALWSSGRHTKMHGTWLWRKAQVQIRPPFWFCDHILPPFGLFLHILPPVWFSLHIWVHKFTFDSCFCIYVTASLHLHLPRGHGNTGETPEITHPHIKWTQ